MHLNAIKQCFDSFQTIHLHFNISRPSYSGHVQVHTCNWHEFFQHHRMSSTFCLTFGRVFDRWCARDIFKSQVCHMTFYGRIAHVTEMPCTNGNTTEYVLNTNNHWKHWKLGSAWSLFECNHFCVYWKIVIALPKSLWMGLHFFMFTWSIFRCGFCSTSSKS